MNTITITLSDEMLEALATLVAAKVAGQPAKSAYTAKEAALRVGVSRDTIERRVKAGLIPRVPGISKLLISAAALERFVNS